MEHFYPQIRAVHVGAVIASGALFTFRCVMLNLFGAAWTRALPLRLASWGVDTTLLTAALMLTTIVRQFPIADGWLTAKVALLILYVVAGVVALGPRRPRAVRFLAWAAATTLFAFIVTIARARHPLGVLATLTGTG